MSSRDAYISKGKQFEVSRGSGVFDILMARITPAQNPLGLAHYLAAYLPGLEAENDPMRGLNLVPTIEREALLAAKLNPEIDHGGPDRMLGELYLHAPGLPVSVGDSSKSVVHYRRANDHGPGFKENRLGLIEALLAEEEPGLACLELHRLLDDMPPAHGITPQWREAMKLLKRMCSMQEPEDIY